jgi:hypothetical protein
LQLDLNLWSIWTWKTSNKYLYSIYNFLL